MSITRQPNLYLSKSLYMTGLQCHKGLWLHKYQPELRDEVSPEQKAIFDFGTEVGQYAQELFPGGVLIPYDGLSNSQQLEMTQDAISNGVSTIYEAAFSFNDVFVKADIMHLGRHGWELYEVKSSASPKEHFTDDIAIQYYVISCTGLHLKSASLVHLNTDYIRQGPIDVGQLFAMVDLTETVRGMQKDTAAKLKAMRTMLKKGLPDIDIGAYCDDPYTCGFHGHCWAHIPENSVFDFRGTGRPKPFDLYQEGIVRMEDVPTDTLGWRQKLQLDGTLYQKNYIDKKAVKAFLNSLWFPLCFMDFETTYMVPIPLFDGMRPYEQLPFQFSLHVIKRKGEEPVHYAFLGKDLENPCKAFLSNLLAAIPPSACILTWNKTFEARLLKQLASEFPRKAPKINAIIENICDLMAPFRDKSIYDWKLNGSYSIKEVLPALVEGYSYENLPIGSGDMASAAWVRMIQESDIHQKERLYNQLLEYCHLDTYAMVLILAAMKKLIG
ncbi:MAG: DUF2779 domain-containing protein [Syntrophobacteraceae bacterium]